MILKLVLGYVSKLYVDRFQTGHTYLLPSLFCGRLLQGFLLVVFNFHGGRGGGGGGVVGVGGVEEGGGRIKMKFQV